jgi:hypothetical protein
VARTTASRIASFAGGLLAASLLVAAVANAGPVWFILDTFPVNLGRHVKLDFDPSKLLATAETPDSIAFDLPARWRFDGQAVAKECTATQAAAVNCPKSSWIGLGHVVTHVHGYLFAEGGGGDVDGITYLNAYLGQPVVPGDPAAIVIQAEALSANPLINVFNTYLGTNIKTKTSITGRLIKLRSGPYSYEASFSGMPGGFSIPPLLAAQGVSVTVTRFRIELGAVRRVRKNIVHVITLQGLNGPTQERIHDHVLIGHHLLRRARACPASGQWPWQITVGFPDGVKQITGTVRCGDGVR